MTTRIALFIGLVLLGGFSLALAQDKDGVVTDTIQIKGSVVSFKMVKVPAGKVTIKDKEGKAQSVELKSFWIGKYEVTWDEYDIYWIPLDVEMMEGKRLIAAKLRPSVPYMPPDRGWGRNGWPAGSMKPIEAQRYVEWLSKTTGKKYRLATEAQWQYACTAGGTHTVAKSELKDAAWYKDNSEEKAHPVGLKKANPWGLHDMLGNVAEYVTREDGSLTTAGGSFQDEAEDVHPEAREDFSDRWQRNDPNDPKGRSWMTDGAHVGLRVVREE